MSNNLIYVYGLFASSGIFAITAWMSLSILSNGLVSGGHGASGSVVLPLSIACFIMAIHCLTRLVKEAR